MSREPMYELIQLDDMIIVKCDIRLGAERLKDLFKYNRFFFTSLITARAEYMEKVFTGKWLIRYYPRETIFPINLAKREFQELSVNYEDDKIIFSVPKK